MSEDKRKYNGGHSTKGRAGRPPKDEEQKVVRLGTEAIIKVYGSLQDYFIHIAKESKDSFPHLKLLQEYVFGKPKETVETINHNLNREPTKEEAEAIAKALMEKY